MTLGFPDRASARSFRSAGYRFLYATTLCFAASTTIPICDLVDNFLITMISRDCYRCRSTHSLEDCDAKRDKVSCPSSQYCLIVLAPNLSGVKDEEYLKTAQPLAQHPTSKASANQIQRMK